MKIRSGFVSNSSSSSFVVAFDKKPKNISELQEMLFGSEEWYRSPWEETKWSAQQVSETVWDSLVSQSPLDDSETIEAIRSGYFDDYDTPHPDINDFRTDDGYNWDVYDKECQKSAIEAHDKFVKTAGDKKLFKFEYSDNDGEYFAALEHGDLFRKLKHIQISHH